ncbi:restriction endonuclease subunit S [Rhizobium ruizarguesonis]|uniref:restriction endonuclease subunit S n=1 Tax=Rhizobium ruizarguesonis TaxID=2081791 RepID=UPI0013DF512D|nr:restriction endonuclease subunit S [Rhizobium ruizarguesonis]NEJ98521.1 restriction endonuclease subunit S [Rhizobium ruizarguesonis]
MTESWTFSTLGEIAAPGSNGLVDGPFGSNLPASSYRLSGVPVVRGSNLSLGPGLLKDTDFVFVDEAFAQKLSRSLCSANDIIFTKKGTLGQTGFVPSSARYKRYLLSSNQMKLTVNEQIADPKFVYYFVSSQSSIDKIIRDAEATGVPKTNVAYLKSFPIFLPPIDEQRSISSLLSSLDDKIELNRRMNETLEAMAQAIFRDWFVDFGPTRRKLDGATDPVTIMGGLVQDAERAQALADLFPAALGDDGLPEGWRTGELGDGFDTVMGQSPPGTSYNGDGIGLPFFQGRRDFGFRFPQNRVYCTSPSRIAEDNWTLISVRAPVGDVNRSRQRCCIGRGVGAILHRQSLPTLTYYTMLELKPLLARFDGDGTVFGSINQKQVKSLPVVLATAGIIQQFEILVSPLDELIRTKSDEVETLASTRDLLLPKLMSGEIRLGEGVEVAA